MVLLSILGFARCRPPRRRFVDRCQPCIRSGIFIFMGAMIMANALHAFIIDPAQSYDAAGLLLAAVCGMRFFVRMVVKSSELLQFRPT